MMSQLMRDSTLENTFIEVLEISPVENRGSLRAFVNVRLGNLIINDCRVIQEKGKNAWVSMPVLTYQNQYGTTRYKTLIQVLDEYLKNQISQAVLLAWENTTRRNHGTTEKQED